MSAISKTCNHGHNILEISDVLINFSFATSEVERDFNKIAQYNPVKSDSQGTEKIGLT